MIDSMLIVCTANICRSPMAEYEMRRLAPSTKISSAGVSGLVGERADKVAMAVASKSGLNLSPHVARQICDDVIFGHDLIVVMDEGHFQWMRAAYPEDRARIVKLMHWSGGHDIPDPYRRSVLVYQAVFKKIQQGCMEWCRQLNLATTIDKNSL